MQGMTRGSSLVMAVLLPLAAAGSEDLATKDGLGLTLDSTGSVKSCRVDDFELLRPGAAGGFFVADVGGIPAQEVELLSSPGFEQVRDGKPVGWSAGGGWSVDGEVARSGKTSMRVRIPGPETRSSGDLSVEVPVKPNTPYRVSMWVRTEGVAPPLYIVQLDSRGKQHRDYPQSCVSHDRDP